MKKTETLEARIAREGPLVLKASGSALTAYTVCIAIAAGVTLACFILGPRRADPHALLWLLPLLSLFALLVVWSHSFRVELDSDSVTYREFLRRTRTMRKDELAKIGTYNRYSGRAMYRHYLRLTPKDAAVPPLDMRTDFFEYRDIKALRLALQTWIG